MIHDGRKLDRHIIMSQEDISTINSIARVVRAFEMGNPTRGLNRIVNTNTLTKSVSSVDDDTFVYLNTFREFVFAVTHIKPMDEETFSDLKDSMLSASRLIRRLLLSQYPEKDNVSRRDLRIQCRRVTAINEAASSFHAHVPKAAAADAPKAADVSRTADAPKAAAAPRTVPVNAAAVSRTVPVNAYSKYAFGASGVSEKLMTLHATVLIYLALKDDGKHGMIVSNFPELLRLAGGYPDLYQQKRFVADIRQKFCFMEKVNNITGWYKFDVTVMDAYARICRVVLSQEMKTTICKEAAFHKWRDISPLCGPPNDENVYLKCLRLLSKDVKQGGKRRKT